ncbi:hypothetical protein BDV28DRAFT_150698 [Aspergillus coremiiformis]|uniref:SET domain-containing protein n=1 Tax=Aspergillus coremiiformis TaxID=138285 RepID=A0A5N6YZ31_9EURO|nr:hypothetical protein BDV28DRAFT_150698 [Aspergillus coremiiformis]
MADRREMDLHRSPEDQRMVKLLVAHAEWQLKAKAQKGQPFAPSGPRETVLQDFTRKRMDGDKAAQSDEMESIFLPSAYEPCVRRLSELNKIMAKDLLFETHHRGSYVLLRSVCAPSRNPAVVSVVEDEEGSVLMLHLHHQDRTRDVLELLGEGHVVLVKEPFFKRIPDGTYGIRVDHLPDVVFLPEHDPRVPRVWQSAALPTSADEWKAKGNVLFHSKKYYPAIECYTKALDCQPTPAETHSLKLNRCLAFLKTEQLDAALADAEAAIRTSGPSEKALFRKSRALYDLRRYRDCCDALKDILRVSPNNEAANAQFTRAIARLKEQEHGKYALESLYAEAARLPLPCLDHATYIGPVAVRSSGSRGRGLFTTKPVAVGELLLCEKAFAYSSFEPTSRGSQSIASWINTESSIITNGAQAELFNLTLQKLHKNPSLIPDFNQLHRGKYKSIGSHTDDGTPVVDTYLVESIVALNVFEATLNSRDNYLDAMDRARRNHEPNHQPSPPTYGGLWPTASYINHSCTANAQRAFIGDMMILRATQPLPPNTELTIGYKTPTPCDYAEQQQKLQHWDFECDCAICEDLRTTPNPMLAERKHLQREILSRFQTPSLVEKFSVDSLLHQMARTYLQPAVKVPRLPFWDPLLGLAEIYILLKDPVRAIKAVLRALRSLGFVVDGGDPLARSLHIAKWGLIVEPLVDCWMVLVSCYAVVAPLLKPRALYYAQLTYKICIGEDGSFFDSYRRLLCQRPHLADLAIPLHRVVAEDVERVEVSL